MNKTARALIFFLVIIFSFWFKNNIANAAECSPGECTGDWYLCGGGDYCCLGGGCLSSYCSSIGQTACVASWGETLCCIVPGVPKCESGACNSAYAECSPCEGCQCGSWSNQACGGGGCASNKMQQTRNCDPNNCELESRCVDNATCSVPDSCTVSISPITTTITVGLDKRFTATVANVVGDIDSVRFVSGNSGILNPDPTQDTIPTYRTRGEGVSVGSTTLTANVYMGGASTCSATTGAISVVGVNAWWQAKDYTLLRSGNIITDIPSTCVSGCLPFLGLDGDGGFPGLAVYGNSIDTGSGNVSGLGWGVNTALSIRKTYDYDFFARQIPDSITFNEITSTTIEGTELSSGGVETDGYYWYHFDGSLGDLTINDNVDLGDRKVVLMVDGANLTITRRIFLNDGTGFFAAFVGRNSSGLKGDIIVDGDVSHPVQPELEGLFHADGDFFTGTLGVASDTQLHVNGMISSETNIVQERDLTDNSDTPAFFLEYAPELTLLMPKELMTKSYKWEEVAP